MAGVRVESALAHVVNSRWQTAGDHTRNHAQARRKTPLRTRNARLIFACDCENFVRTQLRVERGPCEKIDCTQIGLRFAGNRADRTAFRRGQVLAAGRTIELAKEKFLSAHTPFGFF